MEPKNQNLEIRQKSTLVNRNQESPQNPRRNQPRPFCGHILKEEKDADTILLMEKRKKVILSEMDQWSSTVLKELTKLRGIDDPIVRKCFHERKEYLISEGLLENVDTTRQRSLLERFRSLYQLAKVNGIEIENMKIIEACSETKILR